MCLKEEGCLERFSVGNFDRAFLKLKPESYMRVSSFPGSISVIRESHKNRFKNSPIDPKKKKKKKRKSKRGVEVEYRR